ncbi:FTR1 family protein [Candidatus Woesearchaeota archaeon]|nr:MAG: high-affinity iron transporter [archaeon GW2011_AR4]MBS3130714.1 FTR1 family protein [Candidatus Woesearchaeota archaeon]HIH38823.1 high-affinity iron transporter [Candidatus Woesearchaeota archaeon]HIH49313.1 high-affinity iron transporter [Candidatus Woesearchaeota archaeon]HIJ04354.1 high-affinity iron transporter [Candidatus Woesearchaeota archaeon]
MIESFLITSRETLEAGLVVGIVLGVLNKENLSHLKKTVYWGIVVGVIASAITAFLFTILAGEFEGVGEQLFEGTTMLLGAVLLTTMILWMFNKQHAKELKHKVHYHLSLPSSAAQKFGLFSLIVLSILREGVETILFLGALSYADKVSFLGGFLGIITAIIIGWVFFMESRRVDIKKVFMFSSILLILFAAGLLSQSAHEFEEAGVLPGIISPIWDINPPANANGSFPILHEKGLIGGFFRGLFGYDASPSLLQVIIYFSYLLGISMYWRKMLQNQKSAAQH